MAKIRINDLDRQAWKFTSDWTVVRLIGAMTSVFEFWIPITSESGRQTWVRKVCLDWDAATQSRPGRCPYCKAGLPGRPMYYSNAIIRDLQTTGAAAALGTSPVRVVRIPPRLCEKLDSLAAVNHRFRKRRDAWKQYALAHPKFGRDVRIKINPDTPYRYYDVEAWENTRLTAEELAYPIMPLEIKHESMQQAKAAWQHLQTIMVDDDMSASGRGAMGRRRR
jgi:hypothetical protein